MQIKVEEDMDFAISILEQGLIYGILGLGVYITYKILDFPDLTVDGSFPLGAAVTAFMLTRGVNPYLTLLLSFAAGALAGVCTGLIHVKCKVRDLLSGIIMMTALWTINLYIAGTANVPLFSQQSIFKNDMLQSFEGIKKYITLIIAFIIALICKILLDVYLKTKSGYLLRAVGDNDVLVTSLAKDQGNVKILGLAIANGLVSLSGCVFAQEERVFEISMGTGALVLGLASVIIGTSLLKKVPFIRATTAVLIGSIIYKLAVAIAIRYFSPQAMKLITAILFLVVLVVSKGRKKKIGKVTMDCNANARKEKEVENNSDKEGDE
jgi:putative ABC transport system permease protein